MGRGHRPLLCRSCTHQREPLAVSNNIRGHSAMTSTELLHTLPEWRGNGASLDLAICFVFFHLRALSISGRHSWILCSRGWGCSPKRLPGVVLAAGCLLLVMRMS